MRTAAFLAPWALVRAVVAAVVVVGLLSAPLVPAPAARATDVFASPCPQIPDPPPGGFKLWSDVATWAPNPVPGVGAAVWANATIPCGTAVLLDVAVVNLTVLQIQGLLKLKDDPALPSITVNAAFVVVEGQLTVGSPTSAFSQQATFMLLPNPNGRANYGFTSMLPAEPAFPRNMGHKAFVVVGGQVRLYGMPGGRDSPSWVRLNRTANVNDQVIVVDADVSTLWPVGGRIAITSTDYEPSQAEEFSILGFGQAADGTLVFLDGPLRFMHWGDPFGLPDGFGGFVDERGEVALLTRNIVITGLDEPPPLQYEGGHFMVFMTNVSQFIDGVEFLRMGQQGVLGRYNIHFHVCLDSRNESVVRKNTIHDSKQRCVVLHSTHNLTVDSNVAYNTSGHCFMVEEGGEMNNLFINNLGFLTRAVDRLIPLNATTTLSEETDNSPSTFWITNMLNNYINNVAGGSENSGYWTELKGSVRGMSLSIPSLATIVPNATPLGTYSGNVAHSNRGPGWRCYPSGIRPRNIWDTSSPVPSWQWQPVQGVLTGFRIYKHQGDGFFMHQSWGLVVSNSVFADNGYGINIDLNANSRIINSTFVGLTNNYGNPRWCTSNPTTCGPITGCTFPLASNAQGRSRLWSHWLNPTFGVIVSQASSGSGDGNRAHNIINDRFSFYNSTCSPQAAVGVGINTRAKEFFNAGTTISGMVRAPNQNILPFWFPPANFTWPNGNVYNGGEIANQFVIWDRDGSAGGTPGYVVLNNSALLPPQTRFACSPVAAGTRGLSCGGVCYRTLRISYVEPGFTIVADGQSDGRKRGDYSYLSIRRVEDGVTQLLDGNLMPNSFSSGSTNPTRIYYVNLFAPATYEVSIGLPTPNPSFWPTNMTFQYMDAGACGAPLTLRVMARQSNQWAIATTDEVFWSTCAGVTFRGNSTGWSVQYNYVCYRMRQVLQLRINGSYLSSILIVNSNQFVQPCRLSMRCGIIGSGDWFFYNTSGAELHSLVPGSMGFQVPGFDQSTWVYGEAIIGFVGWNWGGIRAWTPPANTSMVTFYYRKTFTIANSACYTGLWLEYFPQFGLIVYLNNVEAFRYNINPGNVTTLTFANASSSAGYGTFNTTFLNLTGAPFALVEGTNYLALETHIKDQWARDMLFDMRLAGQSSSAACTGATVLPEVCDGIDNDGDGTVDIDPATGRLFTRPCSTSCGRGIETCISGAFQNCTAPPSFPETCNGRDDNCDGLVDNGLVGTQLNCPNGTVCFTGQCLPLANLTTPVVTVARSTGPWLYYERGWLWQSYPTWTNATNVPMTLFKSGTAPFGTAGSTVGNFTTTLLPLANGDTSYYFLRSFSLTAAEASSTFAFGVTARRDDGIVVYANGLEIWRHNIPAGALTPSTSALSSWSPDKKQWYSSPNTRASGLTARAGTNWIAAQVVQAQWSSDAFLDLELTRYAVVPCSALPGSPPACVRLPPDDNVIMTAGVWRYLDALMPLPPFSWINVNFDDSAWPSGVSGLGFGPNVGAKTVLNMTRPRIAYFFRRVINVPDASCLVSATFNIRSQDGAVVYVNGNEAFRFQMPTTPIFPTTPATFWPRWGMTPFTLPGGWLVSGNNTIAVELHLFPSTTQDWLFDMTITGQREGFNCTPLPL